MSTLFFKISNLMLFSLHLYVIRENTFIYCSIIESSSGSTVWEAQLSAETASPGPHRVR